MKKELLIDKLLDSFRNGHSVVLGKTGYAEGDYILSAPLFKDYDINHRSSTDSVFRLINGSFALVTNNQTGQIHLVERFGFYEDHLVVCTTDPKTFDLFYDSGEIQFAR